MSDTATLVRSALATRRTVRITYRRSTDWHYITVVQGEQPLTNYLPAPFAVWPEAHAEQIARELANRLGLDVSRQDVP